MRCRYFLNSFIVKWNSSKILDLNAENSLKNSKKENNSNSNLLLHALNVGTSSSASLISLGDGHLNNNSNATNSTNVLNSTEERKIQTDSIESIAGINNNSTNQLSNSFKMLQNLPQITNSLEKNLHFELPMSIILKFISVMFRREALFL